MFSGKSMLKATVAGILLILVALIAIDFLADRYPSTFDSAQQFVLQNGLPGIFVVVFIGSSLLPFPTDLVYSVAVKLSKANPVPVIAVAVLAAFVASLVNYFLALVLRRKFVERMISKKELKEAKEMFDRYGPIPIVLFGVIPASPVFDPLTFVAGLTGMDLKKFAFYSLVSRVLHFGILAAITLQFF